MFPSDVPSDALARAEEVGLLPSALRAKRNTLLPIIRLPSDILEIIFIHGARSYHEIYYVRRLKPSDIPGWVNVSYVCSHWRNVALNCATLWTYHFNISLRWTNELLLRSKQTPLKISCTYPQGTWQGWRAREQRWWLRFIDNLLKRSEHIERLRFHLPFAFLPANFSFSTSSLQSLDVQLYEGPKEPLVISIDEDTLVLRNLRLVCCPLPWYSLNLSRLNELSLHRAPRFQQGMGEFLSLLNSMPGLTILRLEFVLPSGRSFLSRGELCPLPTIDLPHLALLAVIAPLSAVVVLLSCVIVSSKASLVLETQWEHGSSVDDYAPILSFLAQQFRASDRLSSSIPRFRSLTIDTSVSSLTFSPVVCGCDSDSLTDESYHYIPLKSTPGPFSNSLTGGSYRNIPLKITLGDYDNEAGGIASLMTESDEDDIMSNICSSLPLTNVQRLSVIHPRFLSTTWEKILGPLDGLRYMKLSEGAISDLTRLSLTAHESKANLGIQPQDLASDHVFVPLLERLELYHIDFVLDDDTHMSKESLFDALSSREKLRGRINLIECRTQY